MSVVDMAHQFLLDHALVLGISAITLWSLIKYKAKSNQQLFFPGPKGYPVVGIFYSFLKKPAHIVFDGWTKIYGNFFKFTVGENTAVVLGSADIIKKALLRKDSSFDSRCQWRKLFTDTFKGISSVPYSRKMINTKAKAMKILKNLGMGKSTLEILINQEVDVLINRLLKLGDNGKDNFVPIDEIRKCPMSVTGLLLFGEKTGDNHTKAIFLLNTVVNLMNILSKASIFDILPKFLRPVAGFSLFSYHKSMKDLQNYIEKQMKDSLENKRSDDAGFFVDEWIKENEAEEKKRKSMNEFLPKKEYSELTDVIRDLIIAGAHSSGILLGWIVLFLAMHKDEQEKLHNEIIEVIGADGKIENVDRSRLVQMDAFIHESHRMATILPLVAHATSVDTTLENCSLPKDTEVIYNNWSVNHDEKNFPEPHKFKPERWIGEDGKLREDLKECFFPYGIGKRACAGKALARMQIFLTTSKIVQKLEISPPDESAPENLRLSMEGNIGLLNECKPYMLKVRSRDALA